jgi:hypothetical protein
MPEPMQEPVPGFVGSGLARCCSTPECCCCTVRSTTSGVFAVALVSFSGALLLNISTSVSANIHCGKSCLSAIEHKLTQSFHSPAGRTLRLGRHLRIDCTEQNCHHNGAYDCEPFRVRSRVRHFTSQGFAHRHRLLCSSQFVKKNWENCGAEERKLLKVFGCSISVTQRSRTRCAKDINASSVCGRPCTIARGACSR